MPEHISTSINLASRRDHRIEQRTDHVILTISILYAIIIVKIACFFDNIRNLSYWILQKILKKMVMTYLVILAFVHIIRNMMNNGCRSEYKYTWVL